ncbi:hypothetical protein D3C78_651570 [compost metagenome]
MHIFFVEHPGGGRTGKVRADELGFGAVFIADDLQGSAGDQVGQAGQQTAIGNKTDTQGAQVCQGQALAEGDHQLVTGVVALGHQHCGAIADDFTDSDCLLQGIGRVGGAGVGQAADAGKLDALRHRDDQQAVAAVIVEHAAIEPAVLAGALAGRIGAAAAGAVETGPTDFGLVVELRHRSPGGIDHAGNPYDHGATFGNVDVAGVDQGAAVRIQAETAGDIGADTIDRVDHADQGQLVQLARQHAVEGYVESVVVAAGRAVADGDAVVDRVTQVEAQSRRGD